MTLNRTAAIILRQYYLIHGSLSRVFPLFVWVAVDMVLWGFLTKYLNTVTASGLDFVPVLLGAVLLWDFFSRVMQGVTMAFFEDVWSRNFLNLFSSPLSIREYLGGLVLTSILTSTVGLVVMLVLASTVFGLSFVSYGLLILPFMLVLFLFGIALGIGACAIVLRLGPAAEWFVWPIPGLLSPFAGVFYPLSTLPPWMQAISRLLPPSYVFEGMRAVVAGRPFASLTLAWARSSPASTSSWPAAPSRACTARPCARVYSRATAPKTSAEAPPAPPGPRRDKRREEWRKFPATVTWSDGQTAARPGRAPGTRRAAHATRQRAWASVALQTSRLALDWA